MEQYSYNKKLIFEQGRPSEELQTQFENLGLTPENIHGNVLDIGAGEAEFGKFFSGKKETSVTSLDKKSGDGIVQGDVRNLPFSDNTFDLVVSHASIPNIFISFCSESKSPEKETHEAVSQALSEIIRILKPEGEARLAPIRFAKNYPTEQIFEKAVRTAVAASQEKATISLEKVKELRDPFTQEEFEFWRIIIKKNSESVKREE